MELQEFHPFGVRQSLMGETPFMVPKILQKYFSIQHIKQVILISQTSVYVGSQAYARTQAAIATPIVGVYQMDMIGYNIEAPHSFEVHVGYAKCADNYHRKGDKFVDFDYAADIARVVGAAAWVTANA